MPKGSRRRGDFRSRGGHGSDDDAQRRWEAEAELAAILEALRRHHARAHAHHNGRCRGGDSGDGGGETWGARLLRTLLQLCGGGAGLAAVLIRAAALWLLGLQGGSDGSGNESFGGSAEEAPPGGAHARGRAAGSAAPPWQAAFALLGLDATAAQTAEAVRSAYRKRSLKCHPDKSADADAAQRFAALSAARDVALAHLAGAGGAAAGADAGARGGSGGESEGESPGPGRSTKRARRAAARAEERAHEAAVRSERARMGAEREAAAAAARAASAAAQAGAAAARREWEARVAEDADARRRAAAANRAGGARKGATARAAAAQERAAARAAAEAAAGPPPTPPAPAPPTPASTYAGGEHPVAVIIRARAAMHLAGMLQSAVRRAYGHPAALRRLLLADTGAGATPLHHAAHARWAEGVQIFISCAGGAYCELVLACDDDGHTPAQVAAAAAQRAAAAADAAAPDELEAAAAAAAEGAAVTERLSALEAHARAEAAAAAAAKAAAAAAAAAARIALAKRIALGVLTAPLRLAALPLRAARALLRKARAA
jgi:hypothetical protein